MNKFALRVRGLLYVIMAIGLPKDNRRNAKGESICVTQHFGDVKLKVGDWVRVRDLEDNIEGFLGFQNEGVGYVVLDLEIILCCRIFLVAVVPEAGTLGSHLLLGNPGILNLDNVSKS